MDVNGKQHLSDTETAISRHDRGPIEGPLKPLGPFQHYRIEGFKRVSSIGHQFTPKEAILSPGAS